MAAGGLTFFTDANIAPRMARLLEVFDTDSTIRPFELHFAPDTPDVDWLRAISQWTPKPCILGGDGRILRNRAELAVFKECDLMYVFLAPGWTNLAWRDQGWKILKAWPDIVADVRRARQPSVFEVNVRSLKVELRGTVASLR